MVELFEVPGEASPLDQPNVLNALVLAASATQQQVQTGTKQLQHWEKQKMYYPTLQNIFADYSLPTEVRYLAIIQLKNGIDRYWRKTATNAIAKEEKQLIKTRALEAGILEPERPLALQNALMVAKILRYEFPHDWPDAISSVLSFLRSAMRPDANPQELPRALLLLLQIIKELSTARLQRTRLHLQSIAPELLHVLGSIYVDKVDNWNQIMQEGYTGETSFPAKMEQSLMTLKIIRRLIISGYEHPGRHQEVKDFWQLSCQHFDTLISFSHLSEGADGIAQYPEPVQNAIEKHTLQLSKFHVDMAKSHPASFALFTNCIELVHKYWKLVDNFSGKYVQLQVDTESEGQSLPERVVLRGLLLVRACTRMAFNPVQTFKYQSQEDKEERKQAVERIKKELLGQNLVLTALETLVTSYFRFRTVDFQEWEADPESWVQREEVSSEAWEFSIRSCSEKLFLDLIIHFKELLIPRLLSVFQNYANTDNRDVLIKDSLYSAVGLAAASLEQHLNFNNFLEMTMVPEVQIQDQAYKLLRRRVSLVLGQWSPIKYGEMNTDALFQIFQHLLNREDPLNDLVVRITAGRQLRNVLEPYEFASAHFMPYAQSTLGNLMALVQEVELSETKMGLLETVRVVVVKMEHHIAPFADQILSLLPPLWEESGEEHLMKQAILNLLSALIHSLKQESVRYHPLILPLIQSSVHPDSEISVYLLDEALELWSAIIMQTITPASPEILNLLPAVYPILQSGTDSAPQALQIVESYLLLAPENVFQQHHRVPLLAALKEALTYTTRRRTGVVPRLAEMLIRSCEAADGGSEATFRDMSQTLVESGFLSAILAGLHSAYEASETTGPNRKTSDVVGVVETDYFSVLARLALANPSIFARAVSAATSPEQAEPPHKNLPWLLKEWFQHYDNISSVNQKKLHVLALTQLLALKENPPNANNPNAPANFLREFLQSYLTVWTDLILELAEGSTDPNADYLVCWNAPAGSATAQSEPTGEVEPPESHRRRDWDNSDVIHRFPIRDFVRERLQELVVSSGGPEGFKAEWLANVDTDVVAAFGALGLI